jgi:flagellin-like hook-associated protein FlgL
MGNIFSKIFGGGNPETVADSFAKLPDEQKQQIVEVAKNYSTPAPAPVAPVVDATASTAEGNGKEETPIGNGVADATNDTNNLDQNAKTEGTNMSTEPQAPATTETTPAPAPVPAPAPNPMPDAPKVEYASKEDLTAFQTALAESNKLIADQAALLQKQNAEMGAMRKELDDTKTAYSRFVNPSKEFDVNPQMGVAHVGGSRQSYKDIAAKTFKGGN